MAKASTKKEPAPKPTPRPWPADSIERWELSRIKEYPKNARVHSPEQIQSIAASMKTFGVTTPVLVDEEGVLIFGHGRLAAAKLLNYPQIPVSVARGWTEDEKRAYRIADNAIQDNSGFDLRLLRAEIGDLKLAGFELKVLGFPEMKLVQFLAGQGGMADPEAIPELTRNPVSKIGDLWLLGEHRLLCADALDVDQVDRLIGEIVPDIANCDPPYGIGIVKGARGSVGGAKPFGAGRGRVHGPARREIIQPGLYDPIIGDDTTETALKSYRLLSELKIPTMVMWGANYYANELPPSRCWLVWDKETSGTFADVELAWTNQDAVAKLFRHQWNGLMKASERGERRLHPTQKPVALAEWVIETVAPEAKTVVDLFIGSGSTLIACERKGLACLGAELAPAYVDATLERWQTFSAKQATLEATGQTFEEVRAERLKAVPNASKPEVAEKVTPTSRASVRVP